MRDSKKNLNSSRSRLTKKKNKRRSKKPALEMIRMVSIILRRKPRTLKKASRKSSMTTCRKLKKKAKS